MKVELIDSNETDMSIAVEMLEGQEIEMVTLEEAKPALTEISPETEKN